MTTTELNTEWTFRYSERVALLCLDAYPTHEEHRMASAEADKAIEQLKNAPVRCWQCGNDWSAQQMHNGCCPTCTAILNLKNTLAKKGKLRVQKQISLPYAD